MMIGKTVRDLRTVFLGKNVTKVTKKGQEHKKNCWEMIFILSPPAGSVICQSQRLYFTQILNP